MSRLLLATICLTALTVTAKQGTIGYGINFYHPVCCSACTDSLAMVYLNCTTFSESDDMGHEMKVRKRMMGMEMMGETSDECYGSNQPYQESLAFCIKQHCDMEGVSYDKQNAYFQRANSIGSHGPSLEQSLPAVAPTEELAEDAEWLNTTMLVNEAYWSADRNTLAEFAKVEKDHISWSIAILVTSVGIPVLTGLYLLITSQLPVDRRINGGLTHAFHSYFALSALGSKRHSEPLRWNLGYVPSRALGIWIFLYITINVLASSMPYKSVQPSSWYTNRSQEIAAYVANRTGVLSFANMALAMLFSTRNNPLLYVSGWDQTMQITFHRWAARVAVLQAVVHSIVYTADYMYYMDENTIATEAAKPYWWWGIIGTTAMSLMVGLSALPIRKFAYEVFLISHIVLAILSLLGCWYHISERFGKKWGYEVWLYIAFAFWAYDRLVRFGKTMFNIVTHRPKAVLQSIENTNVVMMTIRTKRAVATGPGQHTYVHFLSSGKFWESHPFTICDWSGSTTGRIQHLSSSQTSDVESSQNSINGKSQADAVVSERRAESPVHGSEDYIRCLFRTHKGMTSAVSAKLAAGQAINIPVAFEGTYGGHRSSHFALNTADIVLCVAGGIGVTYAAGFLQQFARESSSLNGTSRTMPRCRKIILAWSVREQSLLIHCQKHILPDLKTLDDGTMQYRFWLTSQASSASTSKEAEDTGVIGTEKLIQQTYGRMDVGEVVGSVMRPQKRIVVVVCGPGSLSDEVRSQVARYARDGYVVDLLSESFSW